MVGVSEGMPASQVSFPTEIGVRSEVDESMPRQIAIFDVRVVSTGIGTAKIVFSVEFWGAGEIGMVSRGGFSPTLM